MQKDGELLEWHNLGRLSFHEYVVVVLICIYMCMYITVFLFYEYVVAVLTCKHVYNSFVILCICGCSIYLYASI